MRHLEWILAVALVAAFVAPMALDAQPAAMAAQDAAEFQDYAQREAVNLEEFTGGHHGVVLAIVLIAAVIVLIAVILPW